VLFTRWVGECGQHTIVLVLALTMMALARRCITAGVQLKLPVRANYQSFYLFPASGIRQPGQSARPPGNDANNERPPFQWVLQLFPNLP
jgi:hypothetical protein